MRYAVGDCEKIRSYNKNSERGQFIENQSNKNRSKVGDTSQDKVMNETG